MSSEEHSRNDQQQLMEVATALADSSPIDWQSAENDGGSTTPVLRRLRSIERLSDAFRRASVSADATSSNDTQVRTSLFNWGPLQVIRSLGKGGFGAVYLAWDPMLDREVALKLHRSETPSAAVRRFQVEEARRLARVRHPNVLTVHGAAVHDGTPGLWSDFIRGHTLDALLTERGRFDAMEVVRIGIDLCRALAALHAAGIVHGDIKASNVMEEHGGRIVLMDLGAGQPVGGDTRGPVYVTRSTAASEVLNGESPTTASDIYSLGALLFRLLTASNPQETASSLRDLRPNVPAALERVVHRALLDDSARRFPSADAMEQALQRALDDHRAVGTPGRTQASERSRWRQVGTAATAIGIAVVAAVDVANFPTVMRLAENPLRITGQQSFASSGSIQQAAFSPDATRVAYISDESGSPQLWVQDIASARRHRLTNATVLVGQPNWTPDSSGIVYTEWGTIKRVAADGGDPEVVRHGWNASVGTRTGRLVFERGEEVWVAAPDGSNARKVAGIPEREMRTSERLPVFSPDESQIAFVHAVDRPWGDIWVVSAEGGTARPLTAGGEATGKAVWTPDGRTIVFPSRIGGRVMLWQVNVQHALEEGPQQPLPLSHGEGEDSDPAISGDGRSLLFTATRNRYTIDVLDVATATESTLREWRAHVLTPSLSSDGRRIVFFGWGRDGRMHVHTMDADGGNVTQVTGHDEEGESMHPVWLADDRELFFYRVTPEGRSWRRISATGGRSAEVTRGWTAVPQFMIRVDPSGQQVIYTWYESDFARGTRILDLETDIDREFHRLLRYPSFTPDGRSVIGMDAEDPGARSGPLVVCPIEPGRCRQLAPVATYAKVSADGATVYFQRPLQDYRSCELWSVHVDGTNLRKVQTFVPESPYLPSFDIGPSGEILLQRFHQGRHEIWLADLSR